MTESYIKQCHDYINWRLFKQLFNWMFWRVISLYGLSLWIQHLLNDQNQLFMVDQLYILPNKFKLYLLKVQCFTCLCLTVMQKGRTLNKAPIDQGALLIEGVAKSSYSTGLLLTWVPYWVWIPGAELRVALLICSRL